jgi:flavodoxin
MNIAVRYLSKSGNTEKVAQAIALAIGVQAVSLEDTDACVIREETGVLFLGAAVYGFGVDDRVKSFIQNLDGGKVKKIALFSTTALVKSARPYIKKLLLQKGIPLTEQEFHCRGKFSCFHQGRPNTADLEKAKAFAKKVTA